MENRLYDYATGKEIKNNPEETYRQLFERILIDDLGYPKDHIGIEVVIQRGSSRNAEKADIVVYSCNIHRQENMYIVIEIETPKKKYDLQAFSYVTATTAPYVVWFAGYEKTSEGPYYLYRDMSVDPTNFIPIPTLPRYGETQDIIGKYRKHDLKPAKALKLLFQRLHFKLYGAGPIKREENVAKEIIKLLFCKIIDELSPGDLCEFRATTKELVSTVGKNTVKSRIDNLYNLLLDDPELNSLFANEPLEYDSEWTSYIVSELQGVALLHPETNTDALGDAYEVLLPSTLKGESGQFFTPREVVRFAIDVISPQYSKNETILDPACGSGGFLTIAVEKLRNQIYAIYKNRGFSTDKMNSLLKDYAGKYVFGCDIDPLLYRIAKSYMAIVGDGKSNIYNFDSLEPFVRFPSPFSSRILPGTIDVITTNPPFGTKIDDIRDFVLKQYDLGHKIVDGEPTDELLDGQDPDKLFLERDIQFLKDATTTKDGGRMVIVLPRQNLSGAEVASVELRKWLLKRLKILAVVDLPRETFQPHTGTKTSLVFLQKVNKLPSDYPIFMAVSEAVGHDRRGNPLYRKDSNGKYVEDSDGRLIVWNDLPEIYEQWVTFFSSGGIASKNPSCFVVNSSEILADSTLRIDAWYWDPNKNDFAKNLEEAIGEEVIEIVRLGDLVTEHGIFYPGRHRRNYVEPSKNSVPFYGGSQILQVRPFGLKHQPKDYEPAQKHYVYKDWILITRSGSTGRVVMVTDTIANKMVSEHAIRVVCDEQIIDPYYVYAYLASERIGKTLLEKGIYASVVDHITPDFVASIPIARLRPKREKAIAKAMREAEDQRDRATKIFDEQQRKLEAILYKNMKKY